MGHPAIKLNQGFIDPGPNYWDPKLIGCPFDLPFNRPSTGPCGPKMIGVPFDSPLNWQLTGTLKHVARIGNLLVLSQELIEGRGKERRPPEIHSDQSEERCESCTNQP